jgi:mannose-6-phosphate isomerase-like protein (cupin superfamily)
MKLIDTKKHLGYFKLLIQSSSLQSALMVLKAGQSSSDEVENEHPKAEQWLYVISGRGQATVGHRSFPIKEGSLLLIEKREKHRVVNTGSKQLVTLNFYAPPAYRSANQVKPSVATN